ncbi:unnamed protein product [Calicophoron daubneyi]|uniref:Transmembrane protein 222 n=1 Tax=Calicophoron daubneyi TaxID=300641 RepID=A0AAV2TVX7_CALDB
MALVDSEHVIVATSDNNNRGRTDSTVNPPRHRFPHCLVWTPIPILTWILPIVGHLGITSIGGVIYDFAAPYTVNEDDMAFGWPTMYCQLDLSRVGVPDSWDKAVFEANECYKRRVHHLLYDNCHSHVAHALNGMRYDGKQNWNMFRVGLLLFCSGKYVSRRSFLSSWLPFMIIASFCLALTLILTVGRT